MRFSTSNSKVGDRYLRWVLLPGCGLLIAVGLLNWFINPLLLFDSPLIVGLNRHKPAYFASQHEVKPYLFREFDARQLILGSSRAGNGLDPQHPGFDHGRAFNYSLPGAKISILSELLGDAVSVNELDLVVVTLDFFAFNSVPADVDYRDAVLREHLETGNDANDSWSVNGKLLRRRLEGLFSWAVTQESFNSISLQEPIDQGTGSQFALFRNGHWRQTLPPGAAQLEQIRETEQQYMRYTWFPPPTQEFQFSYEGKSSFEVFEEFLVQLHKNVETTILVISPLHARFQSALELVGLDGEFEDWKRKLISANEDVAISLEREPFPLWDFADFGEPNREATPASGDSATRMRYYVDGQHYTSELGNRLLDRIFDTTVQQDTSFGSLLTSDNVEDHLQLIRARQQQYVRTNPADMEDLRQSYSAIQ